MVYSTGLTLRSWVCWEFSKIVSFVSISPWLQGSLRSLSPFSCFYLPVCGLPVSHESFTLERHLWSHPYFSLGDKIAMFLLTSLICLPTGSVLITSAGEFMPVETREEMAWTFPNDPLLGFPVTLGPGSQILPARAEPLLQGPGHTGDGVQWVLALAQLFRGLSVHQSRFITDTKLTKGISFTYLARWSSWSPDALTEVAFLCEYLNR